MRSCYKSGKILSDARENRTSCLRCTRCVSVRIRSEEQGALSQRSLFGFSSIFRKANTENPVPCRSLVSLRSEITRKHLPRRLANHWIKFYQVCSTIAWQLHTRNSTVGDSRYKLFFEVFKLQSRSQITSQCPVKCCKINCVFFITRLNRSFHRLYWAAGRSHTTVSS